MNASKDPRDKEPVSVTSAKDYQYAGVNGSVQVAVDEVDLRDLAKFFWSIKHWIITVATVAFIASAIYAYLSPRLYKSEGVYVAARKDGKIGGLAAQYGGLAALAGIDLNGSSNNDLDQAVVLIKSRPFLESLINEHGLKPFLLGLLKWDRDTEELIWDRKLYNPETKIWSAGDSGSEEPTNFEAYEAFRELITIHMDAKTGLLNISVVHKSPVVAADWVRLLVLHVNRHFRERDMREAKMNISFLEKQIQNTSIAEMQSVFYEMLESQIKTLMLAEAGNEYLIRSVVEPMVPEVPFAPKRLFIVGMATFLAVFVAAFAGLVCYFWRK